MSNLSNIQNANNFSNLDGLSVINADQIYIDGQELEINNLVPYTGAIQKLDMGFQNIQTSHTPILSNDVINLNTLSNAVTYIDTANALTYLNKITYSDQSIAGNVSHNGTASFSQKARFNAGISLNSSPSGGWDVITEYTNSDYQNLIFTDSSSPMKTITFRGNSGKIACSGLDASKILISDAYQTISSSGVDSIKVLYLENVSSDIQTQLNTKSLTSYVDSQNSLQDIIINLKSNLTGGNSFSGSQNYSDKNPNTVAIFDASKNLVSSALSTTELNYISGVSSNIQGQLNVKADLLYVNINDELRLALTGGTLTGNVYNSVGGFHPYKGGDTNKGVFLFANNADGSSYESYNGGIGSWSGIGFFCSLDNTTRFMFDTRTGNSSQTGTLLCGGLNTASVILNNLTADRALFINGSKIINTSPTTSTELSFLNNVTSPIQSQINVLLAEKANISYVDEADALRVLKTGDTMTGQLSVFNETTDIDSRYTLNSFLGGWSSFIAGSEADLIYTVSSSGAVGPQIIRTDEYVWARGPKIRLDKLKTYQAEFNIRRINAISKGGPTFYFVIQEYTWNGVNISGDGADWYYPISGVAQSDLTAPLWYNYKASIGPNGGKAHASNAFYISVGFIVNNNNPVEPDILEMSGFKIYPIEDDIRSNLTVSCDVVTSKWFKVANNYGGLYWNNFSRGLCTPEYVDNPYGHVSTVGNGRNEWAGYGLRQRYCLMTSNNNSSWGIHDNTYGFMIFGSGGLSRDVTLGGGVVTFSGSVDRCQMFANASNIAGGYFYYNFNNLFGTISDRRIKKDFQSLPINQSISFIKALEPTSFCLKESDCKTALADGNETGDISNVCSCRQDGWIAQNVLNACEISGTPKSVINHWYDYENELKLPEAERKTLIGVSDRPILSHTVNVVKELMTQIETLSQRNQIIEEHARELEDIAKRIEDTLKDYKQQTDLKIEKLASLITQLLKK